MSADSQPAICSPCPNCGTIQPLVSLGKSFLTGDAEYGYACSCGFHSIAMVVPKDDGR